MSSETTTPVLIAGGGPVGLTLACELGSRGVACVLLEQKSTTTAEPKCTLTNMRSMEHFRRLGIAEATRRAGVAEDYPYHVVFATQLFGHTLCRFEYASRAEAARSGAKLAFGSPLAAEQPQRISQIFQEPVLRAAAEAYPNVDVRFGWRVVSATPDGDGVRVEASEVASGRRQLFRARFVAACDGGASPLREAVGLRLEGRQAVSQQVGIFFRAPELRARNPQGDAVFWFIVHPSLRRVPLAVVDVREPAVRALYARELVLVRPDQHVAWRGNALPHDALALVDRVRGA